MTGQIVFDNGHAHDYLVLKEPASDVVANGTGVVVDLKMSLRHALLGGFGLAEGRVLAQMLAHHLLQVGFVSGLGDDALFLQHGQDAHLLLNQLNGDDQVHTEVDEGPLDTLALVLLLLLNEHVVVEELLETLVGVVDQKLLQHVELENLETGNVQDTCKHDSWREKNMNILPLLPLLLLPLLPLKLLPHSPLLPSFTAIYCHINWCHFRRYFHLSLPSTAVYFLPMKFFLGLGVSKESLTSATTQSNIRAKRDLQVAETEKLTWSTF